MKIATCRFRGLSTLYRWEVLSALCESMEVLDEPEAKAGAFSRGVGAGGEWQRWFVLPCPGWQAGWGRGGVTRQADFPAGGEQF